MENILIPGLVIMNFAIFFIQSFFFVILKSRVVFATWSNRFIHKLFELILRTSFVCLSWFIL